MPGTELILLDSEAKVIVEYDPDINSGKLDIVDDSSVMPKLNLAERGVKYS